MDFEDNNRNQEELTFEKTMEHMAKFEHEFKKAGRVVFFLDDGTYVPYATEEQKESGIFCLAFLPDTSFGFTY